MAMHFEWDGAGWSESTEEYYEGHMAAVAERIAEIVDYGPLQIHTDYPSLPGEKYDFSGALSAEQAVIGHDRLTVKGRGEFTQVAVGLGSALGEATLGLAHINRADVDHTLGRSMPLHGKSVPMPVILERDDATLVEWCPRFIEYGRYERVEASVHPDYWGVGVIKLYSANKYDENYRKVKQPTLEEAKAEVEATGYKPMTFLISLADGGKRAIVTSQIGYDETRSVVVRPPENMDKLIAVEMVDLANDITEDDMVERHVARLKSWHVEGDPHWPAITPMERDEIYLYVTSD